MAKEKTVVKIGGMHCAACSQTIEKSLNKEFGITNAVVNIATEQAIVEHDPQQVPKSRIAEIFLNRIFR